MTSPRTARLASLAALALVLVAPPAGAQEPPGQWLLRAWEAPPWARGGLRPLEAEGAAPPGDEEELDEAPRPTPRQFQGEVREPFGNDEGDIELRLPRLRFEATARIAGLGRTKTKIGPARTAHTFAPTTDTHLPREPMWGGRLMLEMRFHEALAVGVHYTTLQLDGPRRHVHHTGVALGTVVFPGGSRVKTSLDIQEGDVFLRYVVLDDVRYRLGFGIGAGWTSYRIQLRGGALHAGGRVETFFTPTVGYFLALRLLPATYVYVESSAGLIAPWRFPSLYAETRAGLRFHLGQGVELLLAVNFTSAQIEDVDDLWGGRPDRPDHRWKQASWSAVGGEVGFSFTY